MIDILKSRLEDALKDATKGVSIFSILSIMICTAFINFNQTHSEQILNAILQTEISDLVGDKSILLNIKIKEIFYATITTFFFNKIITLLKSEYFDLLYLTILKQYISKIKITKEKNTTLETEVLSKYRTSSNAHCTTSILIIATSLTALHDKDFLLSAILGALAITQIIWSIHTSAKYLIARILPLIINSTPEITQESLDELFSKL